MKPKQADRRLFLKNSAAVAGLALGAPASLSYGGQVPDTRIDDLHKHGERSHFVTSVRVANRTPLQDSAGMITPASLHYTVSHGYEPPDINPAEHRLLIHGLVDHPLIFTLDDLKRLPSVSRFHYLECHGNSAAKSTATATVQDTHGLTSCSEWTGVSLSLLLNEVGVQKGGSWIIAEGADPSKHSKSIPMAKAMDDVLVAYGQNGEPVRPEQGYPLRLLVPGWQGINNVKWLRRIDVVDQPYMSYMESVVYPSLKLDGKSRWFELELGPKSVITRPSGGQHLPGAGYYEITGLAWSGGGVIRKVEVSTDGGRTWKSAQLQEPVARKAHTRFTYPWNWNGEEAVLQSRCTDERGEVQPTVTEVAKLWGASDLEYLRKAQITIGDFNAIQPWRVGRDGSVQNALY